MIDRIGKLDLNSSSSIEIIGFSKTLKKECQNNHEFLAWKYGKHHLKKSYMDRVNFCMFVLGGNY